jgi:acetyltransferase-like isoleucine patch superfamily enzyme
VDQIRNIVPATGKVMLSVVKLRTRIRKLVVEAHVIFLRYVWGMSIGEGSRISLGARLDRTNPSGIHIGANTGIGTGAVVLTHDFVNTRHVDTRIGSNCHIGINAIILPGVSVGDHCIIAPASVVMKDVPTGSLVAGNPARIIETGLVLGPWGIRNWDGRK